MLPFFGVKERLVLFQRDVRGSACRLYPLIPFLLIGVRLTSFPLFYKSSSPVLSVTSPLARTTTAPEVVSSRARTSFADAGIAPSHPDDFRNCNF